MFTPDDVFPVDMLDDLPPAEALRRATERLERAQQWLNHEVQYLGCIGHRAGIGLAGAQAEVDSATRMFTRAAERAQREADEYPRSGRVGRVPRGWLIADS